MSPEQMIPHWRPGDEERLKERVRRLVRSPKAQGLIPTQTQGVVYACQKGCLSGDHSHAVRRMGPFRICRCLDCPDLVL